MKNGTNGVNRCNDYELAVPRPVPRRTANWGNRGSPGRNPPCSDRMTVFGTPASCRPIALGDLSKVMKDDRMKKGRQKDAGDRRGRQDAGVPGEEAGEPRGWYSRGYLPHLDAGEYRSQFITCRLFDSLPQNVLARIEEEIRIRKPEHIARERFILAEKYLDKGYGGCFLGNRGVAEIVRDSLLRYDGERYRLLAWVIMPNHIHLLLRQARGHALEKIVHSFKSYTALEANRLLGRTGPFWMREVFDRYIRDEEHFARTIRYIEKNPVAAGLSYSPENWEFSSAWNAGILPADRSSESDGERQHLAGHAADDETV